MSSLPVSLQLYTVRDDLSRDTADALARVARMGYRNVELAGLGELTAAEMKRLLDDNGLSAPSAHVGIDALQGEGLPKVVDDYQLLGARTLVVPFLGDKWRQGVQGFGHTAEVLNEIGSRLHAQSMALAYHNHDFEFKDLGDGQTGWDILTSQTDSDLVKLELDVYWALFAGRDPAALIDEFADRMRLLHVKDMDPQDRSFAPVGTGSLPLQQVLEAAERAGGVQALVVEQDRATKQTAMEAAEISLRNLKSRGYV